MMADGTDLAHRLAFLSPEMRTALGLPAIHIGDGRGGIAGHRPGFAYSPQQLTDRAQAAWRRSTPAGVRGLSEAADRAWKNP